MNYYSLYEADYSDSLEVTFCSVLALTGQEWIETLREAYKYHKARTHASHHAYSLYSLVLATKEKTHFLLKLEELGFTVLQHVAGCDIDSVIHDRGNV